MQQPNTPQRAGRRRGKELTSRTRRRPLVRELSGLSPAKTRKPARTLSDANAQARRLGIAAPRTGTEARLNRAAPVSAYRQGRQNAKRKPEVHRSKRRYLGR